MAREAPGHTLQPTALVHEAWLRLGKSGEDLPFHNRPLFFAAAAEAMRRILIESARRKHTIKRGSGAQRVEADEIELALPMPTDQLLAVDEAHDRLAEVDERAAEIVKLCYYVGLTRPEAAKEMEVSLSTAERLWRFARAWLYEELHKAEKDER